MLSAAHNAEAAATVTAAIRLHRRWATAALGLGVDKVEYTLGVFGGCPVQLLETYKQFDWCVPLMQGAVQVRSYRLPCLWTKTRQSIRLVVATCNAVECSMWRYSAPCKARYTLRSIKQQCRVHRATSQLRCCGLPICAHPRMNTLQHSAACCNTVRPCCRLGLGLSARGLPGAHA